ncbi:gamma-glutamyl-gamma-aminobutyrate hydrolase family protein [Siminovitchia sediminis]|uniref:Gamma-glutamyl-gamma-aminobutyrate hydrolase family protein n=1 Tax=Siminovitchia sediminis TaxID=1274353 RepID=A0ABW4KFU0_9BACI
MPKIGLTSYRIPAAIPTWTEVSSVVVPNTYLNAVFEAGGSPVIVPSSQKYIEDPNKILDSLDGLIVIGGNDVTPELYGQEPHPETVQTDKLRDETELALIRAALDQSLPILGICRGLQLLNVALGGTLLQHVPDVYGTEKPHTGAGRESAFHYHKVYVEEETRLMDIFGKETIVPSSHHQAIDRLGEGLIISGVDELGLIEAVEFPAHPCCIAVQWHPEEDYKTNMPLFKYFVSEAGKMSSGKILS